MNEEELLKAMDEEFGEGAGARWKKHCEAEAAEIHELGRKVGYGRMIQVAEDTLGRNSSGTPHPSIVKELLKHSWKDISFEYDSLTANEKRVISLREFEDIVRWVKS